MKKIEIEIPDGKRAEWVDGVLTLVDEKPEDVTERIKTFVYACNMLGGEHPYIRAYIAYKRCSYNENIQLDTDILAYLKLRIICAALNEGWQPEFVKNEYRCYPNFILLAKTTLENIPEGEMKKYVMIDTGNYDTEYAYFGYSYSSNVPSNVHASDSSLLCLKSEKLAEYCGKQFISLWADYLLRRKGK